MPRSLRLMFRSSDGTEVLLNTPSFNWNKQLVDAGKPVILAMPFPKGTNFGPLNEPTPAILELLRSLMIALHAEGAIATKTKLTPLLRRVAIGGWSSGTQTVATWCAKLDSSRSSLPQLVREVYFFDGFDVSKPALFAGGAVELWFKKDRTGRKLRLICTAYTELEGIALAKRLGSTEALDVVFDSGGKPVDVGVRAMPGRNNYFYTNSLYKSAYTLPPPGPVLSFRKRGQQQQSTLDMTDETNLFLDAEFFAQGTATAFITLSAVEPDATTGKNVPKQHVLKLYSSTEAAAEVHFSALRGNSIAFAGDFDATMKKLEISGDPSEPAVLPKLRHPWAVFGGAVRKGKFVGYMQFCLEESGF